MGNNEGLFKLADMLKEKKVTINIKVYGKDNKNKLDNVNFTEKVDKAIDKFKQGNKDK